MDSLFVEERRIEEKAALLAVVCDGVGSRADGAFASAYATESLASWFYAQTSAGQLALSLRERVLRINREILIHAEQRGLATASTLAAILLVEDRYSTVHAGDSRIYAVDEAQIAQLTRDDAAADGKLEQYLGRADGLQLQYSEADTSGQSFLLCTAAGNAPAGSAGKNARRVGRTAAEHVQDCAAARRAGQYFRGTN